MVAAGEVRFNYLFLSLIILYSSFFFKKIEKFISNIKKSVKYGN